MSNSTSVQGTRIAPIGLSGSGTQTETGRKLLSENKDLTMMLAQATADSVYDPAPAQRPTDAQIVSGFANYSSGTATVVGVCGILFIVYGLVSRE
jgi:hypothetical protein